MSSVPDNKVLCRLSNVPIMPGTSFQALQTCPGIHYIWHSHVMKMPRTLLSAVLEEAIVCVYHKIASSFFLPFLHTSDLIKIRFWQPDIGNPILRVLFLQIYISPLCHPKRDICNIPLLVNITQRFFISNRFDTILAKGFQAWYTLSTYLT